MPAAASAAQKARAVELKRIFDEGVAATTAGKHDEAIAKFNEGIAISPDCFDCYNRIAYVHIAGHRRKRKNFILDTHGAEIVNPVWELLDKLAGMVAIPGIMIERDANIPPLEEILEEVRHIQRILKEPRSHAA